MNRQLCETYICQVVDQTLPPLKQFQHRSHHHFVSAHPTDRQLRQEMELTTIRHDGGTTLHRMIVKIFYQRTAASPPEPRWVHR